MLSVKEDLRVCRRKRRCGIKQRRYLFCKAGRRGGEVSKILSSVTVLDDRREKSGRVPNSERLVSLSRKGRTRPGHVTTRKLGKMR